MTDSRRTRLLNKLPVNTGPVVYWMSRDQRVQHNWALIYAQEQAIQMRVPLTVVFSLVPEFLHAQKKHFKFMLEGLVEVQSELHVLNIDFVMLQGDPAKTIPEFCHALKPGLLVTDMSPLLIGKKWRKEIADSCGCSCIEVDAHNIIPVWETSEKQEYAAYTIRPKIHKKLSGFLNQFPNVIKHPVSNVQHVGKTREFLSKALQSLSPERLCQSGTKKGYHVVNKFLAERLKGYDTNRNNPNLDGQSQISPYLHFGQIAAQQIALLVEQSEVSRKAKDVFLEELIVRRELADNFCFYNEHYDSFTAFPAWAKATLKQHEKDPRPAIYSKNQLEQAETHDPLWNAAQQQMVETGKMHGYLRMYWAKKMLEWTKSAEEALAIAIELNDAYSIDGRDPNGYAGIAWSIGGVHDRPWFERPVYGMIRYMSSDGMKRKFDVDAFIRHMKNNPNH